MAVTIENKYKISEKTALVAYGSETGNSEDAALQLGDILRRHHFIAHVTEMDNITLPQLQSPTIVIFVISTTGQGDFPNNSRKFWRSLLRKKLSPTSLNGVNFTTFGLGDSSYREYNFAVKKLYKRLLQLGAEEFYPNGEGDEQHDEGIDGDFVRWSENFKTKLPELFPLSEGLLPIAEEEYLEPDEWIEIKETSSNGDTPSINGNGNAKDEHQPVDDLLPIPGGLVTTVVSNERITSPDHFQDIRLLNLSIPGDHPYAPGDVLTLYPQNSSSAVAALIELQDWQSIADLPLTIHQRSPTTTTTSSAALPPAANTRRHYFPHLTLRNLLIHNLSLSSTPRRSLLAKLSHWTDNPDHSARLLEFSNPRFTDEYYDYITRPRRTVLEVLQDFDSVRIPVKWTLDCFETIRGRQYSIASCYEGPKRVEGQEEEAEVTTTVELCVSLLTYNTILRTPRHGLTSSYIRHLAHTTRIITTLIPGSYPPSSNLFSSSRPLLMVGPGTGIAPLHHLIRARERYIESIDNVDSTSSSSTSSTALKPGPALLLFGNRSPDLDFLYQQYLTQLTITPSQKFSLETAWSRITPVKDRKYVQDLIRKKGQVIEKMLRGDDSDTGSVKGTILICGSAGKMPIGVREAILDVFMEHGGLDRAGAEGEVARMGKEGRWIQETW